MALGAKLIAATLILGASTVGTYAIANGGLGGLSSEGDSSTSGTGETGNQKPAGEEDSANTGENAGLRQGQESVPNAAVAQAQPQPAQEDVPVTKDNDASLSDPVEQGDKARKEERSEGAGDTATTNLPAAPEAAPQRGNPSTVDPSPSLPEGDKTALEPKEGVQRQDPVAVPNVEAEVASDTVHSPTGDTVQQPASGGQGSNLEGTSHTTESTDGEDQHISTGADGGGQDNTTNTPEKNNEDSGQGNKAQEVPGNTDPNKNTDGGAGAEQQTKGTSSGQLDATQIEAGDSHTSSNPTNNGQNEATLDTQTDHNTSGN